MPVIMLENTSNMTKTETNTSVFLLHTRNQIEYGDRNFPLIIGLEISALAFIFIMICTIRWKHSIHILTEKLWYNFRLIIFTIWFKCRRRKSRHVMNTEYDYDVFVTHSSADDPLLKEILFPLLENEFSLKCCWHQRDFAAGVRIIDNIAAAIYRSRMTLVALSNAYLESSWCQTELDMAIDKHFHHNDNGLIILDTNDNCIKKLSKKNDVWCRKLYKWYLPIANILVLPQNTDINTSMEWKLFKAKLRMYCFKGPSLASTENEKESISPGTTADDTCLIEVLSQEDATHGNSDYENKLPCDSVMPVMDMVIFHETADTKIAESITQSVSQFKIETIAVERGFAKFPQATDVRDWLHKKAANTRCFVLIVGNNFIQSNVAKCVFYTATEMVETDRSVKSKSNIIFNFLIITKSSIIESLPNRWKLAILAFKYIDLEGPTFQQDVKRAMCLPWENCNGETTRKIKPEKPSSVAHELFLYDVFLCCCVNDREMVMRGLAKRLEQSGYRVCLAWRDFVVGIQIADNIQMAILESKRTMILFSNAFNKDPLSLWQLDCAIAEANRRKRQIIGVIAPNLDVKLLSHKAQTFLNCTTCLDLESEYFWERVRYCLPHIAWNEYIPHTETQSPFFILPTLARKWNLFQWSNQPKTYDAFISYSWEDSEFITEQLVPKLKSHGLKVCLDREVFPTGLLIKAISKSVEQSKRVIVYLTPNFLKSKYGLWEFNSSFSNYLGDMNGRLLVIKHPDVDIGQIKDYTLVHYLSNFTYVEQDSPFLWDRLIPALLVTK